MLTLEIVKPTNIPFDCFWRLYRDIEYWSWKGLNENMRLLYMNTLDDHLKKTKRKFNKLYSYSLYSDKLNSYIRDALWGKGSVLFITWKNRAKEIFNGAASLPSFRKNLGVYVRNTGIELYQKDQEVFLTLKISPDRKTICHPELLVATRRMENGRKAILDRLLSGEYKHGNGRLLYTKTKKLRLQVAYSFEPSFNIDFNPDVVAGVEFGATTCLVIAVNKGAARLTFRKESEQITALKMGIMKRRSNLLRLGRNKKTGRGRKASTKRVDKIRDKISVQITCLNHKISKACVDFCVKHSAGVLQMENLKGLRKDTLFLKKYWNYYQLQKFIEYKCREKGIQVRYVAPFYTSQRCHKCGKINLEFTFDYRRKNGFPYFRCTSCENVCDADYNAAKNIAQPNIETLIKSELEVFDEELERRLDSSLKIE